MATDILMPKWGLTMKEGKLSKWLKNEGESVKAGEPIFEVETDKITNTVEAAGDGVLFKILVGAGETVPVKTVVGVLAAAGETPDISATGGGAAPAASETATTQAATPKKEKAQGFVLASPIARRLARERSIDLGDVTGTGPNGRVTEKDVLAYTPAPDEYEAYNAAPSAIAFARKNGIDLSEITGSGEGGKILKVDILRAMQPASAKNQTNSSERSKPEIIPFTGMRKIIADNMMASLHNMAQLTVFVECDLQRRYRNDRLP